MELVELIKEEVFCDSGMVARKFDQKHNKVVSIIETLLIDIEKLRGSTTTPKYSKEKRVYRGRAYTAYLMDRDFFSLLAMRFRGKRALEWQWKFIQAFKEMEGKILQYELNQTDSDFLQIRNQGKMTRRQETDVIKEFVDYATAQGSTSAQFYYKHITNATYKALGLMVQRKPKLRDAMVGEELGELILMERCARISMKKYMGLGRNYKDIYQSVKEDLIDYTRSIRLGISKT